MVSFLTFQELLKNDNYNWSLYFYNLLSKTNRTSLENVLMCSYYNSIKSIDQCCCDKSPIRNCGAECCTQELCGICNTTIRICKDIWFSSYHCIICVDCYQKEHMST